LSFTFNLPIFYKFHFPISLRKKEREEEEKKKIERKKRTKKPDFYCKRYNITNIEIDNEIIEKMY